MTHSKSSEMRTDFSPRSRRRNFRRITAPSLGRLQPFPQDQEFSLACDRTTLPWVRPNVDEQADQIFATTDVIAERAPTMGASTVRSISDISRHQRLKDNNDKGLAPLRMFEEAHVDNQQLTMFLRQLHEVCQPHHDVATASLIEIWVDETERRAWFLSETLVDLRQLQTK